MRAAFEAVTRCSRFSECYLPENMKKKPAQLLLLLPALMLTGCVGVQQQRLVSKPNMLFSDSMVYNYSTSILLPQIEAGRAASGGGQASGCTSCR
jgi:hypothetical protein